MSTKLTDKAEILKLMSEGWELGHSSNCPAGRYWMQKNGLCKGGESKNVHSSTVKSMIKKGMVKLMSWRERDPFFLGRYEIVVPENTKE